MASWDPPKTAGESEMSWGPGPFPNPDISYDPAGSRSKFPNERPRGIGAGTQNDNYRDFVASMRSNTNDAEETLEDMYTAEGNPDRYGAQPPLVQQPPITHPSDPDLEPIATFRRLP